MADLGGWFLAADLGIVPELEPRPDHASYLASWLEILKNEKRFIFAAAAHAQRAVIYLHDLQPQAAQVEEAAEAVVQGQGKACAGSSVAHSTALRC